MVFLVSQEEQEPKEQQEQPEMQALLATQERRVMQETLARMATEDHP